MPWSCSNIYTEANSKIIDILKSIKEIESSCFVFPKNYETIWNYNFPENGLLMIKDLDDIYTIEGWGMSTEGTWFNRQNNKDINFSKSVNELSKSNDLRILPVKESFLLFLKKLSSDVNQKIVYYYEFRDGGYTESAYSWVFIPNCQDVYIEYFRNWESNNQGVYVIDEQEVQSNLKNNPLGYALSFLDMDVSSSFEFHTRSVDFDNYKMV